MKDGKITNAEAAEALKSVKEILEAQIHLNESGGLEGNGGTDSCQIGEDYDDIKFVTTNLALFPESSWGRLEVSKKSSFQDISWDFQNEGSPLYLAHAKVAWDQNIDDNIKLTSTECEPLCQLLKACLYYCLPQNCIIGSVRSYNSVIPIFRGFVRVARFLYGRGLYVDAYGNGSYQNVNLLTGEDIICCVEEQKTVSGKLLTANTLRFWQQLSTSEYLPERYQLNINAISNDRIQQLQKARDENAGTFMPISLETLSIVVPYCINLIEKHKKEVLCAYDILYAMFSSKEYKGQIGFTWREVITKLRDLKSELWSIDDFFVENGTFNNEIKAKILKLIRNHPDWPLFQQKYFPAKGMSLPKASHQLILDVARDIGIDLWSVDGGSILYDLQKIRHTFLDIFSTFRDACFILIALVTGMRKSELMHIEANKAWPVPGTDDEYRLEFAVFKTDEASQGAIVIIPIPEIAFKAYKILEGITEHARQFGNTSYLSVNITLYFGNKVHPNVFNRCLDRFWHDLGIEEDIHPHMFRKTLAMFAFYHDPRNITVIKHLFSHKSLAMTLAYVVKLPGISEEINLGIIENNTELLAEVLAAAMNEKIGGKCGLRIKDQLKSSKLLVRLNDDGRETLRQYVDSLLEQGIRILHRCPMNVICTNMHDSVVHISPELCDCEVTNCDYAVFTESSIPDLEQQIKFHEQWVKHANVSDDQIKYSKRIINDCLERLVEVQGKEAVVAQFPEHYGLIA